MFNYDNQNGWPNKLGHYQSPIDLSSTDSINYDDNLAISSDMYYQLTEEINDGNTIRLLGHGNATIFNRKFTFQQLHFHLPSEHTIDGKTHPLEIHLVHTNEIGQTVVVAIMVNKGNSNPDIQSIINHFNNNVEQPVNISTNQWIPSLAKGFHYLGSLTTPPLTEGVEWLVITNAAITVSESQLQWFHNNFKHNNRKTQPLFERKVELYK
ncbi:carbonic anhydrase family protein [Apilactobacillus xinyiensis]|jgi:carbonic anhydrase|uniref:Carbonic anhydrase n=1 Tax=Apilactobacillus xinyiensis TaxID=2841032 RepID=A0ABT0I0L8_9LACO|nr:carbonic anhydrase family protein [Apilactobacillus xinyiensis]MCK8624382.1 carbonic anhydrase family protein [Apilactobacillus xinyiensis]MCL0329628.1 carbonic anhydrase family protein [Apilactobacillus xinyiensis]